MELFRKRKYVTGTFCRHDSCQLAAFRSCATGHWIFLAGRGLTSLAVSFRQTGSTCCLHARSFHRPVTRKVTHSYVTHELLSLVPNSRDQATPAFCSELVRSLCCVYNVFCSLLDLKKTWMKYSMSVVPNSSDQATLEFCCESMRYLCCVYNVFCSLLDLKKTWMKYSMSLVRNSSDQATLEFWCDQCVTFVLFIIFLFIVGFCKKKKKHEWSTWSAYIVDLPLD